MKSRLDPVLYNARALNPIFFSIKNEKSLFYSFEYNPFSDCTDVIKKIETLYWDFLEKKIEDPRMTVPKSSDIMLKSTYGTFHLIDFSSGGFGVIGDSYISRSSRFFVQIRTFDPLAQESLRKHFLESVEVEVRWSRFSYDGGYKHGLKIIGFSDRRKAFLLERLKKCISVQDQKFKKVS
ncbi:MAG: hypothetical protein HQK54_09820 [Oligoflexales bacterium]|nr:hypothetical protein [Oligoflexales bacterium]